MHALDHMYGCIYYIIAILVALIKLLRPHNLYAKHILCI